MPEALPGSLWHGVHDADVRDLAWLLSSADLFGEMPRAALAQPWRVPELSAWCTAWLAQLARDPAPLHALLAEARPTRLGRYAETLLKFFVEQAEPLHLIAANLPLRSHGRTVGEYDFLLETAVGQRLHWELAVKCYLAAPHAGPARLADFVGPNLADRLDLKYTHLVEHQLRLAEHAAFAALGHAGPWLPQLYAKGWLFHHRGEAGEMPSELNRAHERGFWVTRTEWDEWAARYPAGTVWTVLPRLAWLAPRWFAGLRSEANVEANAGAHEGTDAEADPGGNPDQAAGARAELEGQAPTSGASAFVAGQLGMQAGPMLVAALAPPGATADTADSAPAGWNEIARGFVVPDDWPERAAAYARGA